VSAGSRMRRWADERNRDYDTYFAVIPGRPQIILKGESMRREAFDLDERDGLSHGGFRSRRRLAVRR